MTMSAHHHDAHCENIKIILRACNNLQKVFKFKKKHREAQATTLIRKGEISSTQISLQEKLMAKLRKNVIKVYSTS